MTKLLVAIGVCLTTVAAMAAPGAQGGPGGQGRPRGQGGNQTPRQSRPAQNAGGGMRQNGPARNVGGGMRQNGPAHDMGGGMRQPNRQAGAPRREARPMAAPHPAGGRHWARPACPPPRPGALRAWTWVAASWGMTLDGVYSYGDGYYFDGYNYYYNGAYYTTPPVMVAAPVTTTVVTQPAVVTQPVVSQPVVVTQPAVVTPAPPPPPPRRRGILGLLFGD